MIKGIEDFESKLQKAILEFIATNVDMSEDIEVLEVDEYVISINDVNFYVITDAEEKGILARYNKERFDEDITPHSLHAEIMALIFLKDRKDIKWNDVDLYTYRENRYGELRMSKPCKSCMSMIKALGIRRIHYTTNDGFKSININK